MSIERHLSSVDPVHACVVRQQKLGKHLPVPLVVVDPVEAGLLHVGNQGHGVVHPVQLELLKVESLKVIYIDVLTT